ncbi:MAG: hypothetical protein WC495_06835 [Patescibacteria group bacterium]|jgi:hypothetical protein
MGLDMYLKANRFMWSSSDEDEKLNAKLTKVLGLKDVRVSDINCDAAYWRKANAIHKWFVDNCQDGKDECQETEITREQLVELRDLCVKVRDNHDLAPKLLPTQGGFFFGDTSYGDDYFEDVESTIKQIDEALEKFPEKNWYFRYHSSW